MKPYCQMTAIDSLIILGIIVIVFIVCNFIYEWWKDRG